MFYVLKGVDGFLGCLRSEDFKDEEFDVRDGWFKSRRYEGWLNKLFECGMVRILVEEKGFWFNYMFFVSRISWFEYMCFVY